MDDATRARLDAELNGWLTGTLEVRVEDLRPLLAAHDALLAERDYYLERSDHWCDETVQANKRTDAERAQAESDNRGLLTELEEERDDHKRQLASVAHTWAEAQAQIARLEAERAQAAPVLDDVMTTLDWVSTTTEGTPKPPLHEIHRRVGEQMRRINAWRAAREG